MVDPAGGWAMDWSMTKGSNPLKTAALAKAQNGKCAGCARHFTDEDDPHPEEPVLWPTFDHVVPKSKGGSNGIANGLAMCGPCNIRKGNRMPNNRELAMLEWVTPSALDIYERMTEEAAQARMEEAGTNRLSRRLAKAARRAMKRQQREQDRDEYLWPRSYRPACQTYVERERMALTGLGLSA